MNPAGGPSVLTMLLIGVLLGIVVLTILIALILWKARKPMVKVAVGGREQAPLAAFTASLPSKGMLVSFSRGLSYLKNHVAGRDYRYQVPWLLMMGPRGSGTTTVLANAGGSAPLRHEGGPAFGVPGGPEWWFYERGLVLNAPGDIVLRSDGRTSDHANWFALLQLVVRRRPRRPLDGVIVAISAEDLVEDSHAAGSDITTRAEVLCQKLSQLRRAVSMRLPVYVLVTKCDLVPGFASFAAELPHELHAEIFGWSNPYPLEAAFSPDWVDQCCREMHERILEQQMEIFVERNQLQEPDGVFLFPAEMEALRAPLRQYLALIFQSTAYQESYYFRGIYFCGDVAASAGAGVQSEPVTALTLAAAAGAGRGVVETVAPVEANIVPATTKATVIREAVESRDRRPVFLNHLFERKIFPESFLARPLSVIDMSRNRTVLTAQVLTALFVVVMGVGLLAAYVRFAGMKRQHLGPLFQQLAEDVNKSDYQKAQLGRETPAERRARLLRLTRDANDVLRSMALLSQTRIRSVFLPASWNGVVDQDMQAALAKGFGTIVLNGFRVDLTLRLASLIQATTPHLLDTPEATGPDVAIAKVSVGRAPGQEVFDSFANVPQYPAWTQYIAGLRELEQNIARYDRIATPGGGSVEDLRELLKYLQLDTNLPNDFDFNNPYFMGMLQQASNRQFSFKNDDSEVVDADDAVKHAHDLIDGFFSAWFGPDNRLAFDVDQMTTAINRFPARGAQVSYQALKEIADSISRVSDDLNDPAFAWLSEDEFHLADFPAFNQPLTDLQYLQGVPFGHEMEDHGRAGFRKFTADLAMKSTRLTGQLLGLDEVPVQISSSAATLQANLRVLLDQPFVAREPGPVRRLDAGLPVWDRNSLLEADKLYDAYDKYVRGSLRTAPPAMREALQGVALERLQENMLDYMGDAQSVVPAGSPDGTEVQSFNQSLDVLQRLLSDFAKFPNQTAARNFSSVLTTQASRLLVALDRTLNDMNFYAVKDQSFEWWEGEKPLSLAAYDVRSADDLKDYVDEERRQISNLAQDADPLVKFLQPRSAGLGQQQMQALTDWSGIVQQLKKYADKAPGNSVSLLEDFIRTGMDKVAPDASCQDSTRDPAGRSDFFLVRRTALRAGAVARCRVLSERAYSTQIAAVFNRRLVGRFPFSAAPPKTPSLDETDPAALVEFFGKLDQYGKIAADILNQNKQPGKPRDAALGFLSQMGGVRPVFAAFLMGADKNPTPAFDFVVSFRVNQGKEIEGNQISDWALDVGAQSFQFRQKENTGHWKLGDPVRVSLRFADDSPMVPAIDNNQPAMTVHQRTVTFEYTNAWSLFSLLLDHKPSAAEFDRGADAAPQTLSFYIPTTPDRSLPQRKDGGSPEQVRVYLRLTVVPAGAKDGVTVPLPFPAQAPVLSEK